MKVWRSSRRCGTVDRADVLALPSPVEGWSVLARLVGLGSAWSRGLLVDAGPADRELPASVGAERGADGGLVVVVAENESGSKWESVTSTV